MLGINSNNVRTNLQQSQTKTAQNNCCKTDMCKATSDISRCDSFNVKPRVTKSQIAQEQTHRVRRIQRFCDHI